MLKNKNIILTGASGGIGKYVAQQCDAQGANLFLISRSHDQLENQIKTLRNLGGKSASYVADVSDEETVIETIGAINLRCENKIHVLINNAGVQNPIGPFIGNALKEWKDNISINLFGTINMTHAVLPVMRQNNYGKIINLSGGGSTGPRANFSAYSTAKTAVVRFTENIAVELRKDNIFINAVSPGAINTSMLGEIINSGKLAGAELAKALEREKSGGDNPQNIMDLISFLVSNESDGISGKLISAVWDPWDDPKFQQLLRSDDSIASLRRIDNKYYYQK